MSAKDIVLQNQKRIEQLKEDERKAREEREALESENQLACSVAKECEAEAQEKKEYDSEALATLYTQLFARYGSAIDADFVSFCDTTSFELPPELKPKEDEEGDSPPNL